MKKLLLLIALCAFAFVGCDKEPANTHVGKLTLTSQSVMDFDQAGGEGEITYTFVTDDQTRAEAAQEPMGICVVDWITDIKNTGNNSISFKVKENTGEERSATIKVEYGSDSFQVMIMQAGTATFDVNFTASYVGGTYFGKFLDGGGQTEGYNYHIIMSDAQPLLHNAYNGYTEYRFDIYAAECGEFNNELRIPVGTYTLDHQRTGRAGTIDAYKDCSYQISASQVVSSYKLATLVVTEESIVAEITLMNNETHRVVYNGKNIMCDYSETTFADVFPVSQYTDTLTFDVTGGYMYAYYRGDWFGTGNDVWFMHMIEDKPSFSGVYLIFNFIVPKSAGGFENLEGFLGEYTLTDPSKSMDWTFPAGRMRDDSQPLNAWYMECVGGQLDLSKAAPVKDGTIKVEKVDGCIVITVDGKDDAGNDIKGTFSGNVREIDNQGVVK
ncbi:MAG: BACON domain-containing protein [Alistipes sp.]|nr:BACON domain-containing protein [Alistipes sp.]